MSLTSLIDVIFLLLLFFMLTSTFSRFSEIELTSGSAGAGTADTPPLFLQLRPEGLTLNGEATSLAALPEALASDRDETRPLLISLAPEVTAQRLTDLLAGLGGVDGIAPTVLGGT